VRSAEEHQAGNKNDQIDARELARPVVHEQAQLGLSRRSSVRTLKELARSYLTISKDLARVMSRVKAIYRSWGIPCAGKQVYAPRHRADGWRKSPRWECSAGRVLLPTTRCPESLRHEVRRDLLAESKKHKATNCFARSLRSVDPGGAVDRADPDTAPLPHQATTLEIQRLCHRNA